MDASLVHLFTAFLEAEHIHEKKSILKQILFILRDVEEAALEEEEEEDEAEEPGEAEWKREEERRQWIFGEQICDDYLR